MKTPYRRKIVTSLRPKTIALIRNWPDKEAWVGQILREVSQTIPENEIYGPKVTSGDRPKVPQSQSELLIELRRIGIKTIVHCKNCKTPMIRDLRREFCSDRCRVAYRRRREKLKAETKRQADSKNKRVVQDANVELLRDKARELYEEFVSGNLKKRDRPRYNLALRDLGQGDERKGLAKEYEWWRRKLTFQQIPPHDRDVFKKSFRDRRFWP